MFGKIASALVSVWLVSAVTLTLGQDSGKSSATEARARGEKLLALHTDDAATYAIFRDSAKTEKLELRREPIYRWTNPTRVGGQEGDVFVWNYRGHPEVVASIFSHPHDQGNQRVVCHELHSLSPAVLIVDRASPNRWEPQAAGVDRKPIPGAPEPAASAAQRSVQIRNLAREFSGRSLSDQNQAWDLRLLPKPLYRYESTDPEVIDGAVFALVSSAGTDPEIILLIEARKTPGGPRWEYGAARFSDMSLWLKHRDQEVWSAIRGPENEFNHDAKNRFRFYQDRFIPEIVANPGPDAPEVQTMRRPGFGTMAAMGLLASLGLPRPLAGQETPAAASSSHSTRRALVVCGLPGDAEHRTMYAGAVEKIVKALVGRDGFVARDVWIRFGEEPKDGDGPALKASRGLSTRANLAADAEEIRKASKPEDALWVIVLGHAHFDGRRSFLNLPGPDVSAAEFAGMFAEIKAQEQVFVITTSASGFFLKPLSAKGRIGISATEADQEVNETVFPLALADVLASPPADADRDKDGVLSVFELYLATVADVMRRYNEEELIATEHPQLDDNGDGHGSEVQLSFLPPELGGQAEEAPAKDRPKKDAKDKPKEKATLPRTLGPKDDGSLASKVRVETLPVSKPAQAGGGPR